MDAQTFFDKGVEKIQNQDFNGAIEDFTAAITLTSGVERKTVAEHHQDGSTIQFDIVQTSEGRGNIYFNRGIAYMALGQYAEAIQDFTKEIEYSPNDAELYYKRGTALYCLGRDNEAEADLIAAHNLNPIYTHQLFLSQFSR